MFKKGIDPNIEIESLDMILPDFDGMIAYENLYFSKDAFAKRIYVGDNGVFILIPLVDEELNDKEKVRIKKSFMNIREGIGLNLFLYPVLVGNEKVYFAYDLKNPVELDCTVDYFLEQLYLYTSENKISPDKINVDEVLEYESNNESSVTVLDENTIERILKALTPLENNERPQENIKIGEDGTMYILRDSDLRIGRINTGLIGKKNWFRVSDMDTNKLALMTMLGGNFGLHKFMTGEIMQGLAYLFTSGFAGILPALDIISMFLGTYTYNEVTYYQCDNELSREKEVVYLRKGKGLLKGILLISGSLLIGYVLTHFVYAELLEFAMAFLSETGTTIYENNYR